MSLFFTDEHRRIFNQHCNDNDPANDHKWALQARVDKRAASPSLSGPETTTEWWHHVTEYVTDAACAHALGPKRNPLVGIWLRSQTLSLVRRPLTDWVGPFFRNREIDPPRGHLETAHLVWAVAVALDLGADLFTPEEDAECRARLREGVAMCERWLDAHTHLNNWRAVLSAALAVGGAVLNDADSLARAESEYRLCLKMFQSDGSYGESLQYANYAALAMVLSYESLVRHNPALADSLPLIADGRLPRWQAYSHFYCKPLSGWGAVPRPRAANFNDSAAIFRPSADVLLHFAARAGNSAPTEAGLARWLFDETYATAFEDAEDDRASFGFINGLGFLSFSLLPLAARAITPSEAQLPETHAFSNGHGFVRDAWDGRTLLAINGGGDPLNVTSHLHQDLNSFILVHNRERLLVDPGHSCYRNSIRAVDTATSSHNTCTFWTAPEFRQTETRRMWPQAPVLEQHPSGTVTFTPGTGETSAPVDRGARRLFTGRKNGVSVVASDAAMAYGWPIEVFTRVWLQCGAHVLFVVDDIQAAVPVRTTWNWLLNNRDGALRLKPLPPDRLVARRPHAGMKLFCCHDAKLAGPNYGYVHDCYHPLPNQKGEGATGSGLKMQFVENEAAHSRLAAHAIVVDKTGPVANWHLQREGGSIVLTRQYTAAGWKLDLTGGLEKFSVTCLETGTPCEITTGKTWKVSK